MVFVIDGRVLSETLRLRFAKEVDDAISRHAKEPAGDVIDRHQKTVRFDELVEDVLQNVFDITRICHPLSNEITQPGLLPLDYVRDALILFECHLSQACCVPSSI